MFKIHQEISINSVLFEGRQESYQGQIQALDRQMKERLEKISKMTWTELSHHALELGRDVIIDLLTMKAVSAACTKAESLAKILRAANLDKTLTQEGLAYAASIEKVALEEGAETAQQVLHTIKEHPEILQQPGKNVAQVVKEAAEKEVEKVVAKGGTIWDSIKATDQALKKT